MIKLPKRPRTPTVFISAKYSNARSALAKKISSGVKLQTSDFTGKGYWTELKKTLHRWQKGKCSYCERLRNANAEADVDHFRPKLAVTGSSHSGYWWLAYAWKNYFFSCVACNRDFKKNHFPLSQESSRAQRPSDSLKRECALLIDPSIENPELFIGFDWDSAPNQVLIFGIDAEGKGATTINILGLDCRDDLSESRLKTLTSLRFAEKVVRSPAPPTDLYNDAVEQLKQRIRSDNPNSALARAFIAQKNLAAILA